MFLSVEIEMGDLLVQASKYNLVLLYTEERLRHLDTKVMLMLLSSQSHLRGHYYMYTVSPPPALLHYGKPLCSF